MVFSRKNWAYRSPSLASSVWMKILAGMEKKPSGINHDNVFGIPQKRWGGNVTEQGLLAVRPSGSQQLVALDDLFVD